MINRNKQENGMCETAITIEVYCGLQLVVYAYYEQSITECGEMVLW